MNDVPEFELGYQFAKRFWSLGLATECGRAWLRAAFFHLDLERVFAHSDERHEASVRVMRKLGIEFDRNTRIGGMSCSVYRIDSRDWRRQAVPRWGSDVRAYHRRRRRDQRGDAVGGTWVIT